MRKNESWELFRYSRQLWFVFTFGAIPWFMFVVFYVPPAWATDDWHSYALVGVMFVLNATLTSGSLWSDYRTYKRRCRGDT